MEFGAISWKMIFKFPLQILRFYHKITYSVTKRSINEESAFKKSKNPSAFFFFFFFFFSQNYRLNSFFYSSWKQFQVVEIAKFEIRVTVHCGLGEKSTRLWPLKHLKTRVHFARSICCVVSPHLLYFPLPLHNDCNIAGQDSAVWIDYNRSV